MNSSFPIQTALECVLQPTPAQREALLATFDAFEAATEHAMAGGRSMGTSANAHLHRMCYDAVRRQYGLSANLAIRAIACASERLKNGNNAAVSRAVFYDARILSYNAESYCFSLSTVAGRMQRIQANTSATTHAALANGRIHTAMLTHVEDGSFILALTIHRESLTNPRQFTQSARVILILLWAFTALGIPNAHGQIVWLPPSEMAAESKVVLQYAGRVDLPEAADVIIEAIDVRNADLRDVLRALGVQYGLNLLVDDTIDRRITLSISGITAGDVLRHLAAEYGLTIRASGSMISIRPTPPVLPQARDLNVHVSDGLLSTDVSDADVHLFARAIADHTGLNVMVREGVSGSVSGYLSRVSIETGLKMLVRQSGFQVYVEDGIYVIDRTAILGGEGDVSASTYRVAVTDGLVDLEAVNAPIEAIVHDLGRQLALNVVAYGSLEGQVSARLAGMDLDRSLAYLFKGTSLTYRLDGNTLIVGDRAAGGLSSTRLLSLRHIRADGLVELLPDALRQNASFQVIREQNGIVVIGSNDAIADAEAFIAEIDRPTPQILIEALVVDFEETDLKELGISFGRAGNDPLPKGGYRFGGGEDQSGGLEMFGRSDDVRKGANFISDLLGTGSIGRLPADFYLRVRALEMEGKAKVRSRPQIATLNGHTASISVGTTQYYILKSILPVGIPGQPMPTETERFERVDANVSMEITPWVSASGEVTAEIHPEFATPVGMLDPRIPPTINTRVVDTTVRLRDGETVIIGGLIQETQTVVYNKIPVLGDIPLLGHLFRSRRHETRQSELVIFITPHVFYGDEDERSKWDEMKGRIRFSEP